MADLYYIDDDYYTPDGYFVYTADAVAIPAIDQPTFTLDCVAGKIVENSIAITGAFSPTFAINVVVNPGAALTSVITMSCNGQRGRASSVTLSTIVNLSLQGDKIKGTTVSLSSAAAITAVATEYESYIATSPTPFYALGEALISTSQTHFGSHSLEIPNSTSGAKSSSAHTKFNIPSAASATQSIGEEGRFSIAFWYYPTANTSGTFDDIVSHYDGNTDEGWFVQRSGTRDIRFRISDGTTGETTTATVVLTLNDWNWVVITRAWTSGNRGELRIAVNGTVDVTDLSNDYSSGVNSKTLYIGDNGSGNGSAVGYIDGLHIQIGVDTSTTATPTTDSLEGTAYSKLLMNWNSSWFDQSLSAVEQGAASLTSAVSVSAAVSRNRTADSNIASTATLTASAQVVSEAAALLTSESTLSAAAVRLRDTTVTLTSEFTASCSALDLDLAAADLAATVSMTASANVTKQLDATLTAQASQSTAVNVTRNLDAALNCQGFVVAVGLDLDLAQASLTATSQLACAAVKNVKAASSLQTSATATATVTRIKQFASSVNSAFTFNVSEQKIKDVFISGLLPQIVLSNNLNSDVGNKFISVGSLNTGGSGLTTSFAIAFWASGQGYVWSQQGGTITESRSIEFTADSIVFRTWDLTNTARTLTWTGQTPSSLSHYIFYGETLYINGVLQSSPSVSGSGTAAYVSQLDENFLGITATSWDTPTAGRVKLPEYFNGTIGQWIAWWGPTSGTNSVPDFSQSSERLKIYSGGYVDLGSTGTLSQLPTPDRYQRLSSHSDSERINDGQDWNQITGTTVISGETYYTYGAYTPSEVDDAGPFTGQFTLSAQAQSVIIVAVNATSTTTLSASATKLLGVIQNLSATMSLNALGDRIRTANAQLLVEGSELAVVVKTGRTLVDMPVVATVSCASRVDFIANANLNSQSTLMCAAVKTSSGAAAISASTLVTSTPSRTRPFASTINSSATTATAAVKTARALTLLSSQAQLTASPYTTYQGEMSLSAQAQVTANARAGYIASSTMTSSFTLSILSRRLRDNTVNMTALDFLIAIGTKLTLDPYYQLSVQRETNIKKISQESGILTVDSESRVNTVLIDTTTIIVPSETSVWHIPFSPQVGSRRVQ